MNQSNLSNPSSTSSPSKHRPLLLIVLTILFVIGAGLAIYFLVIKKETATNNPVHFGVDDNGKKNYGAVLAFKKSVLRATASETQNYVKSTIEKAGYEFSENRYTGATWNSINLYYPLSEEIKRNIVKETNVRTIIETNSELCHPNPCSSVMFKTPMQANESKYLIDKYNLKGSEMEKYPDYSITYSISTDKKDEAKVCERFLKDFPNDIEHCEKESESPRL